MLRDLWRLRLCVLGVCLLALLAGTAVMYRISVPPTPRRYDVGVARAQILVDTPHSQLVQVAPTGSALLAEQANVLATLMVDGAIESSIAAHAGLRPTQLVGVTNAATEPSPGGAAPVSAPSGPGAYVLTTQLLNNAAGDALPIIQINAQAPTSGAAVRLADAAIAGLSDYLNSKAADVRIPAADRLQVTGLGAPQATTVVRGPSYAVAIVAATLVLVLGCTLILAILALVRGWRTASEREPFRDGELLGVEVGSTPDERFSDELPQGPVPLRSDEQQRSSDDGELLGVEVGSTPDERFSEKLPQGPVPLRPDGGAKRRIKSRAAGVEQQRS